MYHQTLVNIKSHGDYQLAFWHTYFVTEPNVKFMNFYPFTDIETIAPRSLLFITGETSHSREFSEEAYRLAGQPKELVVVPGAGHVDLYDRVELIPFDKLTSFFTENLKSENLKSAASGQGKSSISPLQRDRLRHARLWRVREGIIR